MNNQSTVSYVDSPTAIYDDIDHYKIVFDKIVQALCKSKNRLSSSYLYDGIQIDFSTHYVAEEIYLDIANSKIILRAPKKKYESSKSIQERRMKYLAQLLHSVEAMKTIGISHIFLSLKDEGRKKLKKKTGRL